MLILAVNICRALGYCAAAVLWANSIPGTDIEMRFNIDFLIPIDSHRLVAVI